MKKRVIAVLAMTVCLLFSGCAGSGESKNSTDSDSSTVVSQDVSTGESIAQSSQGNSKADTAKVTPTDISTYPQFDFEKKTVQLNSGYEMPILGLGMFSLSDSEAENSTYWALKAGFRLIDTARIYGNEAAVGRGYKELLTKVSLKERMYLSPQKCGLPILMTVKMQSMLLWNGLVLTILT